MFTVVYRHLRESPINKPNSSCMHRILLCSMPSFYVPVAAHAMRLNPVFELSVSERDDGTAVNIISVLRGRRV